MLGDEPGLAEHAQVLRDGRLRDPELVLDHGTELARGVLAVCEQLEDASPHGVAQDVQRVHDAHTIITHLYKQRLIY